MTRRSKCVIPARFSSGTLGCIVLALKRTALLLFFLSLYAWPVSGEIYIREKTNDLLGRLEYHTTLSKESLIEVARDYGIGYNTVVECNPGLNPFAPGNGIDLRINTSLLLPTLESEDGLVINLSDYRLYYFFSDGEDRFVAVFPIGIGDDHRDTPLGSYTVADKTKQPSWTPPLSMRREDPLLPPRVSPGPDNPLGSHALRLSRKSILIHGTHRPYSVGRKASHGCIHLYPEDIPVLFGMVSRNAKVLIVRQPVKVGVRGNRVFIQVHADKDFTGDYLAETKLLIRKRRLTSVDFEKVTAALQQKNGVPVDVTAETDFNNQRPET